MTFTRRDLMLGTAAALVLPAVARAAPELTDEGLYREPWFLDSFMVLPEDLAEAEKQGKRFVVMWELKGCPYCKETHFTNLARPDIADYIKSNFVVEQLNIIGLKRSGMSRAEIHALRRCYNLIFDRSRTVAENLELARAEFSDLPRAMKIIDFISHRGHRQYTVPRLKGTAIDDDDDED